MKYLLGLIFEGFEDWVEIGRSSYENLADVDKRLKHLVSVEDKYDVTMQNYLEFEEAILQGALKRLSGYKLRTNEYLEVERLLARRLSNVLSSAHLYLNTLGHHTKIILEGDPERVAKVEAAPRAQYDASLDYRIAEAVRNYSQHRALAVHGLIGTKCEDDDSGLVDHVEPYLDPDDLREDDRFKRKVLAELPADGDVLKLKPIIRGYIESLGLIQDIFRQEVRDRIVTCLETLLAAQQLFEEKVSHQLVAFLGAVPKPEEGLWGHVVYVNHSIQQIQRYLKSELPDTVGLQNRRIEY